MNKASPVEARKALEAANVYAKAGIPFVPMPVLNDEQRDAAVNEAYSRLDRLVEEIDGTQS